MNNQFNIHPNIAEAETLPAQFYRSEEIFQLIKEKVFLKSIIFKFNLYKLSIFYYLLILYNNYNIMGGCFTKLEQNENNLRRERHRSTNLRNFKDRVFNSKTISIYKVIITPQLSSSFVKLHYKMLLSPYLSFLMTII